MRKTLFTIGLVATLVLSILYIFQINGLTRDIYSLRSYQKRLNQLRGENEVLKIDFSKYNSLKTLEDRIQSDDFVKVSPSKVKYIQILGNQVAAKQ